VADREVTIEELKKAVAGFVRERNWGKFHTPKNLSMSIAIEAAELMEHFQWTDGSKKKNREEIREITEEIADIAAYLVSLCNELDIDLSDAFLKKMEKNDKKYPKHLVRGKAHKYTYYKNK
jgi:dCTP diphosphatase